MRVAVLDDEDSAAHISLLMSQSGHTVVEFPSGKLMLQALRRETFDLLLLDSELPDARGLEVLAWLKENLDPSPPAIVVTARVEHDEVVAGLAAGADDYIPKPVQDAVLKARVEAVLRRSYPAKTMSEVEIYGEHAFDVRDHSVAVGGSAVATTRKEFTLALLLFRNLGRALSRGHILEGVWGLASYNTRTLDAHISQIRRRLRLRPENGLRLSSVYGFGYRLERLDAP